MEIPIALNLVAAVWAVGWMYHFRRKAFKAIDVMAAETKEAIRSACETRDEIAEKWTRACGERDVAAKERDEITAKLIAAKDEMLELRAGIARLAYGKMLPPHLTSTPTHPAILVADDDAA